MRLRVSFKELQCDPDLDSCSFPKYTTQLINLANQNAQGTRPKVVGQLSELIQEFTGKTYDEWVAWYKKRHPRAIDQATTLILRMIDKLKAALGEIDEPLVRSWVADLVLQKTFIGLRFQEAILRKLAVLKGVPFRCATTEEECTGIDGFLGDLPVSVKPNTYRSKPTLRESIPVAVVFYTKRKGEILLEWDF